MNKHGAAIAVLAVGAVLALIGAIALWVAISPAEAKESTEYFEIPAGADVYFVIEYQIDAGVHMMVTFAVNSPGTVDVFLFDAVQHDAYYNGLSGGNVASASGATGGFDVYVPGTGLYYLAFDHGAGYENVDQGGQATIKSGDIAIIPSVAIGGAVLLIAGIALAVVGWRMKGKAEAQMPKPFAPKPADVVMFPAQTSSGVTFFDERKPPGP